MTRRESFALPFLLAAQSRAAILDPRTQPEWELVYSAAVSALESADRYGPAAGQLYFPKDKPAEEALAMIRNYLQRLWMDWDLGDVPEVVACMDRVMNQKKGGKP